MTGRARLFLNESLQSRPQVFFQEATGRPAFVRGYRPAARGDDTLRILHQFF